ncbi:hypothetical protein BGZ65_000583 [Modicella reniformis]|uniref:N-acetyltransferase domain-containing protein n=1 Tax=Modicella reniformis TaxID=1440133 RepID=A0A9P6MJN6_9FUNG|nr:hypothetical protein BGZ65_000583 [Modicella reniformis]
MTSSTIPTSASVSSKVLPDPLILRLMTLSDCDEVAALFTETFKREPLSNCCGVPPEEGKAIASRSIQDPVSFVVEDTSLEGARRLVAFRTSNILTAQPIAENQKKVQEEGHSSAVQAILDHTTDLWMAKTTVFKSNPEAKVMKFIALGVDENYEGRGLAKALLNAAMDKARETKCDAVIVVASAFATQHLFKNRLGFEEMGKVRYSDFKWINRQKGDGVEERPFPNLHEPEFLLKFEKKLV